MTYQEVVEAVATALCLSDDRNADEHSYRVMAASAIQVIRKLRLTAAARD